MEGKKFGRWLSCEKKSGSKRIVNSKKRLNSSSRFRMLPWEKKYQHTIFDYVKHSNGSDGHTETAAEKRILNLSCHQSVSNASDSTANQSGFTEAATQKSELLRSTDTKAKVDEVNDRLTQCLDLVTAIPVEVEHSSQAYASLDNVSLSPKSRQSNQFVDTFEIGSLCSNVPYLDELFSYSPN